MDLFDRLWPGALLSTLPLVVLLLVCAGAYLIRNQRGANVTDSPWFWAFAFSTVGLLGVWAISGKYDDRQKRMEARYEARQRISEVQAVQGTAGEASSSTQNSGDREALPNGYTSERRVPLHFLASGLVIASVVSLVMLSRARCSAKSSEDQLTV
jgi:hypothetical protein